MLSWSRRPDPLARPHRTGRAVLATLLGLGLTAAGLAAGGPRPAATAAAPSRVAALPAQADGAPILLPVALRHADTGDLAPVRPLPPTPTQPPSPTTTPSPTETPTPTVTPGPSPTPLPPACDRPLDQRLVTRTIAVKGTIAQGASGPWTRYPMYTAVRDDGSSLVAWSTTAGQAHFTPLDAAGNRAGDDIVLPGASVHGLVAHADGGGAALIARPDDMVLVRFDADGVLLFEKTLVGLQSHGIEGAKWIDDWGYEGRLVWTGTAYAAYFGHVQYWGARGKHQGDLLWLFTDMGDQIPLDQAGGYPTWDWGCSHSLDLRLAYNRKSDVVGPVCLSDSYPGKGFFYRDQTRIGAEVWADGGGHAHGTLGGLVPVGNGFAVTYGTESGRRSFDIALTLIDEYGFPLRDYWLTDTAAVDEDGPHLATYGDNLLAAWQARSKLTVAVVDLDGKTIDGPVTIAATVDDRDDFVNYPNGDAGWTSASTDRHNLVSVVIPYCR